MMRTIIKTRRVETGPFFSSVADFDGLIFLEMEFFSKQEVNFRKPFSNNNSFKKTNVLLVGLLQKCFKTSSSRQIRWKTVFYGLIK